MQIAKASTRAPPPRPQDAIPEAPFVVTAGGGTLMDVAAVLLLLLLSVTPLEPVGVLVPLGPAVTTGLDEELWAGERLAGACFARASKEVMVRELFAAGLWKDI